ncbi:hypothetical protein, partial [Limnofasciculus baicalensis]
PHSPLATTLLTKILKSDTVQSGESSVGLSPIGRIEIEPYLIKALFSRALTGMDRVVTILSR